MADKEKVTDLPVNRATAQERFTTAPLPSFAIDVIRRELGAPDTAGAVHSGDAVREAVLTVWPVQNCQRLSVGMDEILVKSELSSSQRSKMLSVVEHSATEVRTLMLRNGLYKHIPSLDRTQLKEAGDLFEALNELRQLLKNSETEFKAPVGHGPETVEQRNWHVMQRVDSKLKRFMLELETALPLVGRPFEQLPLSNQILSKASALPSFKAD